jgi:hypothetical protein
LVDRASIFIKIEQKAGDVTNVRSFGPSVHLEIEHRFCCYGCRRHGDPIFERQVMLLGLDVTAASVLFLAVADVSALDV